MNRNKFSQLVNDMTEAILDTQDQVWLMCQIAVEDFEQVLELSDADLSDLIPPALPSLTDAEVNLLPDLPF